MDVDEGSDQDIELQLRWIRHYALLLGAYAKSTEISCAGPMF